MPSGDEMTGEQLRAWRLARGWDMARAAAELGLSYRGLQDQELGNRKVSRQTRRIVELLEGHEAAPAEITTAPARG